jgi:hypothetical protein
MEYRVGSVIQYQPFVGAVRTLKVEVKEANIKNDRPGFVGKLVPSTGNVLEDGVWGYDSQIVGVVTY